MFLLDAPNELSNREVVLEKIVRPVSRTGIPRRRLLRLLEESIHACACTIISGRAGTGKTDLALSFAATCHRPVAWYKVDAPDGEIQVFFQYLMASIQEHRPRFGSATLLNDVVKDEQVLLMAEAFAYELTESNQGPMLILIEDMHHVFDAHWLVPFFNRLLPLLPSEVHMLITSRTLPPAPLWRMRSKQSLKVIDEDALAFTKSEVAELFFGYGLSQEEAFIALDHTRGRVAALKAFAETVRGARSIGRLEIPRRFPLVAAVNEK